jgi:hypothetical protein
VSKVKLTLKDVYSYNLITLEPTLFSPVAAVFLDHISGRLALRNQQNKPILISHTTSH